MKIEFKCKIDLDGTWYYTDVEGQPVTGSLKKDKDSAYDQFLRIIELKGKSSVTTTLETRTL